MPSVSPGRRNGASHDMLNTNPPPSHTTRTRKHKHTQTHTRYGSCILCDGVQWGMLFLCFGICCLFLVLLYLQSRFMNYIGLFNFENRDVPPVLQIILDYCQCTTTLSLILFLFPFFPLSSFSSFVFFLFVPHSHCLHFLLFCCASQFKWRVSFNSAHYVLGSGRL